LNGSHLGNRSIVVGTVEKFRAKIVELSGIKGRINGSQINRLLDHLLSSSWYISVDVGCEYGFAAMDRYWAENMVLGCNICASAERQRVVIFNRSDAWDDENKPEPNVYVHSDGSQVTFRVWQTLDEQQQSLANFFLASLP
jgi:hypothetical protein